MKSLRQTVAVLMLSALALAAAEFKLKPSRVIAMPISESGGYVTHVNPAKARVFQEIWMWNRMLVHFDVDLAALQKYEKVSATLSFKVSKVTNPHKVPLTLSSPSVDWMSAKKLAYYGAPWPKTREGFKYPSKKGVIEYSYDDQEYTKLVEKDGQVEWDLSELMTRHVMCGLPWNGFVLRSGPIATGWNKSSAPEATFTIDCTSMRLTVKGIGTVPSQPKALRVYPSALLPPVKNPYIFLFYSWGNNKTIWDKYLHLMNADGVTNNPDYLQRGILALINLSGPQADWLNTPEDFANYYGGTRRYPGIAIDEWQCTNDKDNRDPKVDTKKILGKRIIAAREGIKAAEAKNPENFTAVYWRGERSLQPLAKDGLPDLVIAEAYVHMAEFPHWAITNKESIFHPRCAKEDGYYDRLILLHGIVNPPGRFPKYDKIITPEVIYDEVRYCRERWPECPGSGLYCEKMKAYGDLNDEQALETVRPIFESYEKALQDFFITPAPKVVVKAPAYEQTVSGLQTTIRAEATAKDGRTIREYRWFVDNRLMAITTVPQWRWDLRPEQVGKHIITVHAIDSKFNRAAAQIPVTVMR